MKIMVPIDKILEYPTAFPKQGFLSEPDLKLWTEKEFEESIKVNGILRPISVSPRPDGMYAVRNGKHRLCIARRLGLTVVPCETE